ncbi:MAG TPA: IS3 family transposase [Opitutaceae bacterium]|nr:IS3 family transposase [Opitutaceae bacterium]
MRGQHPVRRLCELLQVSASGYYDWRRRQPSARQRQDAILAVQVAEVHQRSRRAYGAPRIVLELRESGTRISRRRCARLMREQDLRGRKRRRWRPQTTDSGHGRKPAPNRLHVQARPSGPNQVWVTDITYVRTAAGWLYLSVILDLWSRRVIGWATATSLHADLALAALRQALLQRAVTAGLIHHSDRGSQYVDQDYVQLLALRGIERSMSRAGNCYDNAVIESFWATLKTETGLLDQIPASFAEADLAVFDYIETFYNPTRRHTSLGGYSPVAFETKIN